MKQEVYMPNGHLIFETDKPQLMYDDRIIKLMLEKGYVVKMDGKKVRKPRCTTKNAQNVNGMTQTTVVSVQNMINGMIVQLK